MFKNSKINFLYGTNGHPNTYAMLDAGSNSLIRQDVARRLRLRGKSNPLLFGTFNGIDMVRLSMVSFKISAVDNSFTFEVNIAFAVPNLNAARKTKNWNNIKESWEKIYDIDLSSAPISDVTILIG